MLRRGVQHLAYGLVALSWPFVVTAAGQSNFPIEIDPVAASGPQPQQLQGRQAPLAASPEEEKQDHARLADLASHLSHTQPQLPAKPQPPATPPLPQAATPSLDQRRRDQPVSRRVTPSTMGQSAASHQPASVDPIESQPLGTPRGSDFEQDPAEPPSAMGWPSLLNTLAALGVVIGLIFLLRAVVTRVSGRGAVAAQSPMLEVLTRVSVAPRQHVLLVRIGNRILVVGEASTTGLRTLADIDDPEEVAGLLAQAVAHQPNSMTRSFNQLMQRFNRQHPPDIMPDTQSLIEQIDDTDNTRRAQSQVSGLLSRVRHLSKRGTIA